MTKKEETPVSPAPQQPAGPQTPAEFVAVLEQQKAQLEAQLNQTVGALAMARKFAEAKPAEGEGHS